MNDFLKQLFRAGSAVILASVLSLPQALIAQTAHVVAPSELNQAAVNVTSARQQNLEALRQFVSSERAQRALRTVHVNPEQVKTAVAKLSDGELARLAARAQEAQADFAAGVLSDRDLIVILLAVAALILIVVAVR